MMNDFRIMFMVLLVVPLMSCARSEKAAEPAAQAPESLATTPAPAPVVARSGGKKAAPEKSMGMGGLGVIGKGRGGRFKKADKGGGEPADDSVADSEQDEQQTQTRAWFPETFLFRPLVLTDDKGNAEVEVRVPDRLTSWRVLALAHSRDGAQAGALTSFLGTLPVYVDPIVPPLLRVGDVMRMPINIVNTTQEEVRAQLQLEAKGLAIEGRAHQVVLGPAGSAVRYATLRANQPATAQVFAKLAGKDAVLRSLQVVPVGRPMIQTFKGTLAAPRSLTITRAAAANMKLGRVRLQVFPGALALLRSELSASRGRGGMIADSAFSLLLAGKAEGLMRALGGSGTKAQEKKTKAELRDLTMLATQRVLRQARVLNMSTATLLAEAALAHAESPILSRLGKRAIAEIVNKQAPDGTCGGETGWSLQRLLVSTAECVRAAATEPKVSARGGVAFVRHAKRIRDPYTAAAVLASGAVKGALAEVLRKVIVAAIEPRKDGSKAIKVPKGVVRADGSPPSTLEATALAILALEGVKGAPLADLGATLLAGYSPALGWGDGRANLVCMKAVLKVFREPLPGKIHIVLERGGEKVAEGSLQKE
ncbi:MAG: hypothetical protein JRH20_25160, partial [Deltaproteobacteria bacterium]|nr:hypothetical protein [Deltaproteobacteria bacterium]